MRFKKAGKKVPRKATTKNISPKQQAALAKKGGKKKAAKKKAPLPAEPVVLTGSQRRSLRGQAHALHALIQVGHKGITTALVQELHEALESHELVKVRLGRHAPEEISDTADALAQKTGAAVVQIIGHVILLYRPASEPEARKITVPKARKGELAREAERAQEEGDAEADGDTEDLDEDDDDATEDLGDDEGETEDVGDDEGFDEDGDEGDEGDDDEGFDEDDSDADDLYDELDEDDEEDDEAE